MISLIAFLRKLNRHRRRVRDRHALKKIHIVSPAPGPVGERELVLFAVVRDEMHHIPTFLTHFRQIGVRRFFIIDNRSMDGTFEYLEAAHDVILFRSDLTLGRLNHAINGLMEKYALGRWCLVADADERLVYPHFERLTLLQLIDFLEKKGATGLYCRWVDLYANMPLSQARISADRPVHEQFPFFDRDELTLTVTKRLFNWSRTAHKTPLFKFERSTYLYRGAHWVSEVKYSELKGCVLHFALNADLKRKAELAVQTKQYFKKSKKYRWFLRTLSQTDPNPYCASSVPFKGSQQMIDLSIMCSQQEWDQLAQEGLAAQGENNERPSE